MAGRSYRSSKNSSGSGGMVPVARTRKRVNVDTCPVCGAKRGETCFVMTASRFLELDETHTGKSVRADEQRGPRNPAPDRKKTPVKLSTPVLDAQYAARKRSESEGRRKLNGG